MPFSQRFLGLASTVILLNGLVLAGEAPKPAPIRGAATSYAPPLALSALNHLPLRFEANQGQTDRKVRFLSRGQGYTLFLAGDEAVLRLRSHASESAVSVVRMKLAGARAAKATGFEPLPAKSNYLLGSDPSQWQRDIPNFSRVKFEEVYPGVDLVYYGTDSDFRLREPGGTLRGPQLEFDFVVAPGADPKNIRLVLDAATSTIDAYGDLVIATEGGEVRFHKPVAYQDVPAVGSSPSAASGAARKYVAARYGLRRIENPGSQVENPKFEVSFELASYNPRLPLVIDPVLSYSTFLGGGNADAGYGITADSTGNIFVVGETVSADFPTQNPYQAASNGNTEIFVAKIDAAGATLLYSTYLGGSGVDRLGGMALDSSGNVYLGGTTSSSNFPTTTGAFQTAIAGDFCGVAFCSDAFVAKLKADGTGLAYSTYVGGTGDDTGSGLSIDSAGSAYLTGYTASAAFPTAAPLQAAPAGGTDSFICKIKPDGSGLVYSTYLGGTSGDFASAIAVDAGGNAFVTGYTLSTDFPTAGAFQNTNRGASEAFVTGINAAGGAWIFSTYLGGTASDSGRAIATDASGNVYIGGQTTSADFPISATPLQATFGGGTCGTLPCSDGFLVKFDPTGATAVYSTYLGGASADQVNGIAVNGAEEVFLTGSTASADFPLQNPLQATIGGGTCASGPCTDVLVARLDAAGSPLIYSTFLGGDAAEAGQAIFVDSNNNALVTGTTTSAGFPATPGAVQTAATSTSAAGDAFAVKIGPGDASALILSAAKLTFADQPVAFTSDPLRLIVTNAGTGVVTFSSVAVTGKFAQTNTCEPTLAIGGATCTIDVTFTPDATGDLTGELTITSDAPGSPHKVALAGKGIEAKSKLVFDPATIEFPDTDVGAASDPIIATVSNTGYADIQITAIETIGNYAQTNDCPIAPAVLARNASCTASLTFKPEGSGTRSGSLKVTSNAGNAQNGFNLLELTGKAITQFSLSAPTPSAIVERGEKTTTFTITAVGPDTYTGSLALTCQDSAAACSFNPASIKIGEVSTLTLSNLDTISQDAFTSVIRGTNNLEFAETSVSVTFSDFVMERKPTFGTVASGDSTVVKVTVRSKNGFDGTVSFQCSSLPAESSCTFTPSIVTLDGTNPASVDVEIKTTTRVTTWTPPRPPSSPSPWLPLGVGLMAILSVLGLRRRKARLLMLALVLLGMMMLASCNDYYYYTYTGTLPGTFSVVITGTVGTVQHSTVFNLTVL